MTQPTEYDVNGTRLAVEEAGAGPAVVFLHGFTLDTRGHMANMEAPSKVTEALTEFLSLYHPGE